MDAWNLQPALPLLSSWQTLRRCLHASAAACVEHTTCQQQPDAAGVGKGGTGGRPSLESGVAVATTSGACARERLGYWDRTHMGRRQQPDDALQRSALWSREGMMDL